jgi:uncharacterized membrane protein
MSEEERKNEAPETGPEESVDRLGRDLGDTADSVTRDLRDLQDELMPAATPIEPEPLEPIAHDTVDAAVPGGEPSYTEPVALAPAAPANKAGGSSAAFTPEGTDDDRLMSMLAWLSMVILQLPIVSIIQLLSPTLKDRPFQRHHAVTSLVFFGAAIVYEIVASVVFTVLTTVTLGCGALCLWVIFFVPHALGLYYAFQAYGGKRVHLKYLSDWAKQQGWL